MEQLQEVSPKRRAKFVAGGVLIITVLGSLIVWAMSRPGATPFYYTTSEVLAAAPGTDDALRVNGIVVAGSIRRDGVSSTFTISDGKTAVDIVTDQPLPDTLKDGSEVVALGRFDGSTLIASQVLAKCPSKFKAKA